jgi:hypothetical protein
MTSDEARRRAEQVAIVCAHIDDIQEDLCDIRDGDDGPLEAVLAATRNGRDIAASLKELHTALQAGGDALGLHGYSEGGSGNRGPQPLGVNGDLASAGQGHEITYVCPADRCTRYWWPQGAEPVPRCAINGTSLRRERL